MGFREKIIRLQGSWPRERGLTLRIALNEWTQGWGGWQFDRHPGALNGLRRRGFPSQSRAQVLGYMTAVRWRSGQTGRAYWLHYYTGQTRPSRASRLDLGHNTCQCKSALHHTSAYRHWNPRRKSLISFIRPSSLSYLYCHHSFMYWISASIQRGSLLQRSLLYRRNGGIWVGFHYVLYCWVEEIIVPRTKLGEQRLYTKQQEMNANRIWPLQRPRRYMTQFTNTRVSERRGEGADVTFWMQ
jgi:hypothetical protein